MPLNIISATAHRPFTRRVRRWGRARVAARQASGAHGWVEPIVTALGGLIGLPLAALIDAVYHLGRWLIDPRASPARAWKDTQIEGHDKPADE